MGNIFRKLAISALVLGCVNVAFAGPQNKADKETVQWRYEVENLGQKSSRGGHGATHILKVWSFSKKAEVAQEQSKKNAIHAVLFQGVPSNDVKRLKGIEPLLQDPTIEATHAGFFQTFFADGGEYMRFVTVTNSGMADMLKVGKEWKVGLTVAVNTPGLRKYLEQMEIILPMDAGFDKAKKPSLMVVPSRSWCTRNGYMQELEGMGETARIPDYRKAFDNDPQLSNVAAKIGNMTTSRGFDLRMMSNVLTTIQNEQAEAMVMSSESGAALAENPIDVMRRVAKADIWMEVDWQVNETGMQKSITFNLSGIDAYSDEQIANCQGTGQPSYSAEIPVLMEEAITNNLDNFNEQLMVKFNEWFDQGRQITVQIQVWESSEHNLESEIGGDELGLLIEDHISATTVNNQFSTDVATTNRMIFTNVRIPMLEESGRAMDARRYGIGIQRMLRDKYSIVSKVMTKGLGQVTIVIGEK